MAEPNASDQSELAENQSSADFAAEEPSLREESTIAAGFNQMQQRLREQTERIQNLEQALDQSIANLDELRSRVADQQFLERQLALTEEIANVQQQAIHQLKLQFAQKQTSLEQEIQALQAQERTHQARLQSAELSAQAQQAELERLGAQVLHDRVETQTHQRQVEGLQSELEGQRQQALEVQSQEAATRSQVTSLEMQISEAQKQIMRLYRELSDRHTAINELEARLEGDFGQGQPPIHFSATAQNAEATRSDLPHRAEELEAQIAKQMANQALLQQACQELEVDRELSQTRMAELERQAAEMQEQILSQAQQASEYEAAVQHWKDRFFNSQEKVARLKELLDDVADLPPEVTELFAVLQSSERIESARSSTKADSPNPDKIDLPDFLTRRRIYRNRQSPG